MRRRSMVQLAGVWLIAFAIVIAVAYAIPWLPHPATREAGRMWFVYWFVEWISAVIFATVAAILVTALINFRAKRDDMSDGPPIHGHTTLEIIWTAIPFVLVTAISIVSAIVLAKDTNAGANPLRITVTTMQFTYTFTYPNGKTYDVLRLPLHRTTLLTLHSQDVIHSFWVPSWGQKSDAVPGLNNRLVVTPTRVGTYPIICTQLCGLGHATMRSTAIVLPPGAYARWYGANPSGTGTSGSASGGQAAGGGAASAVTLFKTTGACGSCHTFAAAGTTGKVGPPLNDLKAAAAKAGQPLEQYVRQSIEQPDAYITPGYQKGVMASSCCKQLSQSQIDTLVQYLVKNTK